MEGLDEFKGFIDNVINIGIGVAGLASGYRIFQAFNRGEDVTTDIIRWVGTLFIGYGIYSLAAYILFSSKFDGVAYMDASVFAEYGNDVWIYGIYIGGVITIIGLIKLYKKFLNGDEDLYDFCLRWFGSVIFLFSVGWVVYKIRTNTF